MENLRIGQCLASYEVAPPPHLNPRAALVIGVDEFFRLALVGLLKAKFNYATIIEVDASDPDTEVTWGSDPVDLVIVEADRGISNCCSRLSILRRRYPGTRVVVVSQGTLRDDILNALRAGAHGFVPKGISVADMVHALTIVLSGTLWIPRSLADDETEGLDVAARGRKDASSNVLELTHRQREVLNHIVDGKSNKQIAKLMSLREGTVKVHVAGLLRNLGVSNRSRAAAIGSRHMLTLDRRAI